MTSPASLGAVLGARNTALFFALGFGAGIPATWGWITLFPRIDIPLGRTPFLVLMSFGIVSLVQLAAAPFLDRSPAPLFRRLGHRRSWAAAAAAAAFVLIALHVAVALASAAAQIHFEAISGVLVFPVAALLWIAIDALRIE